MEKIKIQKSPTADTRTCDVSKVTRDQLMESSRLHIIDVCKGLMFFRGMFDEAAAKHDFDKLSDIDTFFRDFKTGFAVTEWWDRHRKLNRHHLLQDDGIPDDVNLIDVIEMIVDCVMAGMARSGQLRPLELKDGVLEKAAKNTTDLLFRHVEVVESTHPPAAREG